MTKNKGMEKSVDSRVDTMYVCLRFHAAVKWFILFVDSVLCYAIKI